MNCATCCRRACCTTDRPPCAIHGALSQPRLPTAHRRPCRSARPNCAGSARAGLRSWPSARCWRTHWRPPRSSTPPSSTCGSSSRSTRAWCSRSRASTTWWSPWKRTRWPAAPAAPCRNALHADRCTCPCCNWACPTVSSNTARVMRRCVTRAWTLTASGRQSRHGWLRLREPARGSCGAGRHSSRRRTHPRRGRAEGGLRDRDWGCYGLGTPA